MMITSKVFTLIIGLLGQNTEPDLKRKTRRSVKAIISKLKKNIKPRKQLNKIYWADSTFVDEFWN